MKFRMITLLSLALAASCTSIDDSLSTDEQANLDASLAFTSQSNALDLDASGNYTFMGQPLVETALVNGQPQYANLTIDGAEYTVIVAQYDSGMSIYALNADAQLSDIGNSLDFVTPEQLSATQFAGKYFERSIDPSGALSDEQSASIVLSLDPNAGTLTSQIGPEIDYVWDPTRNAFVATNMTSGQAVAYQDQTILGNYRITNQDSTNYGTFWAIGE